MMFKILYANTQVKVLKHTNFPQMNARKLSATEESFVQDFI